MTETAFVDGQVLFAPLFACRPVDLKELPPARLKAYREVEAETGGSMSVYPGSEYLPCETCGIRVAVGPRQAEAIEAARRVGLAVHVLCIFDAAERAHRLEHDHHDTIPVRNLGNPFTRRD